MRRILGSVHLVCLASFAAALVPAFAGNPARTLDGAGLPLRWEETHKGEMLSQCQCVPPLLFVPEARQAQTHREIDSDAFVGMSQVWLEASADDSGLAIRPPQPASAWPRWIRGVRIPAELRAQMLSLDSARDTNRLRFSTFFGSECAQDTHLWHLLDQLLEGCPFIQNPDFCR